MRFPASIVITTWNGWLTTQRCLESLRPTLGLRDEVIVVDNGSTDETSQGLQRYPWVKGVRFEENRGSPAGRNAGAARAVNDILVFLDNDTLLPSRWLDGLLAPFEDCTVGAVAPRSNYARNNQFVDSVPYDPDRMSEVQSFARQWRVDHRGDISFESALEGFCLAVSRVAFESLGGFDEAFGLGCGEDQDLSLKLRAQGRRLVLAHESFVHHSGHGSFLENGLASFQIWQNNAALLRSRYGAQLPATATDDLLLSACLIVKNEADNLAACLASLTSLVDEVIVYDTGSVDETREIAASAGATVITGTWSDDFASARNNALAFCRGRWILHVDADEVVEADAVTLRSALAENCSAEVLQVAIDNLDDAGRTSFTHTANRLFQRLRGHWSGRLHEQVVSRSAKPLAGGRTDLLRIRHYGYSAELVETRGKHERNLRLARQGAEAGGSPESLLNLGKALAAAGLYDEAIETLTRLRATSRAGALLRHGLRLGAESLIEADKPQEALQWIADFRHYTRSTSMPDYLQGTALLRLGDTDTAVTCFAGIDEAVDEDFTVPAEIFRLRRGVALATGNRWTEAAADLSIVVKINVRAVAWAVLAEAHWRAELSSRHLAELVHEADLTAVLAQLLLAPPPAADDLAEHLWDRLPGHPKLLAFVLQLAPTLELSRALDWSMRLRASGLGESCPLAQIVDDPRRDSASRIQSAGLLSAAFSDERGSQAMRRIAPLLQVSELRSALLAVDEISPVLLPVLISGAATTPDRCVALADLLRDFGATEQAEAMLQAAS